MHFQALTDIFLRIWFQAVNFILVWSHRVDEKQRVPDQLIWVFTVYKNCTFFKNYEPPQAYQVRPGLHSIDGRPQSEVQVGPDKLEVVASFCYLGDMLSAGGGCKMAVTTRVKTAWKKFRELLPVLTSRHLSYKIRGHVYSSCVRSAMLHASETWPLTKTNLQRLQCNDRAMIRQICSIKPEDVARVR